MGRLFGTDGLRGLANADLTPLLATRLATAAARVLAAGEPADPARSRPVAVIGRDPRASGEMLEAAVAAGIASAGVDVLLLGVLPTPAVAFLTAELKADLGVVISASHNAMPDNGIKIFGRGGHKLADAVEDEIEGRLDDPGPLPTGEGVGRISDELGAIGRYTDHLLVATPHSLAGLRVVVDCAHGASSTVAPEVYRRAGADVIVIAGEPNGLNINDGVGSTHLETLRAAVLENRADIGIAHDGDADRCLAIAGDGSDVDGDMILAILALSLQERSELTYGTVVTTVMANLGFHHAMRAAGITVRTTGVGDRYLLAEMSAGGFCLGGEQSGHIVMSDYATTGDGLLTALNLMARVASTGIALEHLAKVVTKLPQVLLNVKVADKAGVAESAAVQEAVRRAEAELGDAGRVLLRPSGTEPLVRVMVEAPTPEQASSVADRVAAAVAGV